MKMQELELRTAEAQTKSQQAEQKFALDVQEAEGKIAKTQADIERIQAEIDAGTFGNVYKGSSLETVVHSIAEQRQIFKGADHAFLWKPKLRIPDIYESADNQRAFGRFLHACACCDTEDGVVRAIRKPSATDSAYMLTPRRFFGGCP